MDIHVTVPATEGMTAALIASDAKAGPPHGIIDQLASDATVCVRPSWELAESAIVGPIITAWITFAGDVGADLVTRWLWTKLQPVRGQRVEIDRRIITLNDRGQIQRIVEEHITKQG